MISRTPLPSSRAVEATAPCRLDLAGGVVADFDEGLRPGAPVSIGVALDRRTYCRIEVAASGVRLESKDTLLKLQAERAVDLPPEGLAGLVRRVLCALGAEAGLSIVTQARVPESAGLGSETALAVAVAAATAALLGRTIGPEEWPVLVRRSGSGRFGAHETIEGGVAAARLGGGEAPTVERLRVDPARVEECLLLVDPGPGPEARRKGEDAAVRAELAGIAAGAERLQVALEAGESSLVTGLVAAEGDAWSRLGLVAEDGPAAAIARLVRAAGGAARPCGRGPRSLILVWAEPAERGDGPKEAVTAALKAAGYRSFPARVDLLGLEVEQA